jgi:hypothetical protein
VAETIKAMYSDPRRQSGFNVIWDCTGITLLILEKDDQPTFVDLQIQFEDVAGRGREIVIAPRNIDFNMRKCMP